MSTVVTILIVSQVYMENMYALRCLFLSWEMLGYSPSFSRSSL